MEKQLQRGFYERPTLWVAKAILGKVLVRRIGRRKIEGTIVETEAYVGFLDKASHAYRGRTPRTETMFGKAGIAYIYLIYGMYYCLNVVTEREEYPAAVLIRAIKPFNSSVMEKNTDGPGKVCRYFRIDRKLNGEDLTRKILWIEDRGEKISKNRIASGERIGVDYAREYQEKPWRFFLR